ncbi:hypothetical protein [Rhizobium sp. LCM 4573]|uniref:hypothetical protein n=1 Tax=Rhizobium sp. LCM 4573 TaxID=1848291 RepID=UPI0008D9414F|nr:hypothetical protein [Rhizobium sp. LCM 4573]OHV77241.1 hypothetical protein LCM4573_10810 [Rhizobium sp. LCM 4573]
MIKHLVQHAIAITPADLAMLESVLEEILTRRGIAKGTDAASRIAVDLLDLFQHGIRNKQQLLAMLSGTKNFP